MRPLGLFPSASVDAAARDAWCSVRSDTPHGGLMQMPAPVQLDSKVYVEGYWDKRFVLYDNSKPTPMQAESITHARRSANGDGIRMLELGCGDGRSLFAYNSLGMLLRSDTVIALDIAPQALALTTGSTPQAIPVRADAMQMPFCEESFDFVYCSMLIEHLPDGQLLDNIRHILKSGGVLYLSTVVRRPYGPFTKRGPEGRLVLAGNHLREYKSNKEIIDLVRGHGFEVHETSAWLLRESILRRFIMLCLKLGLFRISLEKRMMRLSPFMKKTIRIWALVVPIPGYYVFEGVFTANG
jgi:SAM-dependent methyltransferase